MSCVADETTRTANVAHLASDASVSHGADEVDPSEVIAPDGRMGRFEVRRRIGQGGMGRVYEGFDPQLGRNVALKVLHPRRGESNLEHDARLRREAEALARLAHPNVVAVYDAGVDRGRVFVAMELVVGSDLRSWASEFQATGRARTRVILDVLLQAARGLHAAHQAGIIHRDVKPTNILVGRDGRVRVADFGLAKTGAGPETDPGLFEAATSGSREAWATETGAVLGTPAYMAPELFEGAPPSVRSDQFAFCVVAWELLFGVRPSKAGADPVAVEGSAGEVPRRVVAVLRRGLRGKASRRFADLRPVIRALEAGTGGSWDRRWVAGMAGLGVAGGLVWSAGAEDPCATVGERAAAVWSQGRARALEERLVAAKVDGASAVVRRLDEQLGPYVEAWTTARVEACQEFRAGGLPAQVHDAQVACLEREIGTVAATVEAVAGEEREIEGLRSAVMAMEPVADPGFCRGIGAGEDVIRPPAPGIATAVFELRRDIELCRAGTRERDASVLEGVCAGLVGRAERLVYGPVLAEALVAVGEAEVWLVDAYDRGMELLERGHAVAMAEHDDALATRAASRLAYTLAYGPVRLKDAERWLEVANVGLSRLEEPDSMRAVVLYDTAIVRAQQGRFEESAEALSASLALQDELMPGAHPMRVETSSSLGSVQRLLAQYEQAEETLSGGIRLAKNAYGDRSPKVALLVRSLGLLRRSQGNIKAASELLRGAYDIRLSSLPSDHKLIAYSMVDLAEIAQIRGDYSDALEWAEKGLRLLERIVGSDTAEVADVLGIIAACRIELGEIDRALSAFARRATIYSEILGANHPETLRAAREHQSFKEELGRIQTRQGGAISQPL